MKDVTKKGYKITADDWENRCVDTFDTLDALIQMMANKETGQASTPIDEDSVNEKVNRIDLVFFLCNTLFCIHVCIIIS